MLVALSICLWALVIIDAPGPAAGAGPRVLRAPGRAPERAHDQPRPAPRRRSSTATASRSRCRVDAESIYAVPQDIDDAAAPRPPLARALGLDAAGRKELLAQLQKTPRLRLGAAQGRPRRPRARCATCSSTASASSPRTAATTRKRELAAQVLGYVGLDNTGHERHRVRVRGRRSAGARPRSRCTPTRGAGRWATPRSPPPTAHTVVLTLDEAIQHVGGAASSSARSPRRQSVAGGVVVMDPRTGEVLAMANRPTFNPNRFGAYPSARWRNRAVADAYEPGSIFKIVTAAARPAGEGRRPRRGDRLRPRLDRDRGHAHQRPRGLRPAHLPRRDRAVERHRRDPRGPAPGPRELQPLHAATSASAPPPASSCPASRAACLRPTARWSAPRSPRCPSARRSASPRCR